MIHIINVNNIRFRYLRYNFQGITVKCHNIIAEEFVQFALRFSLEGAGGNEFATIKLGRIDSKEMVTIPNTFIENEIMKGLEYKFLKYDEISEEKSLKEFWDTFFFNLSTQQQNFYDVQNDFNQYGLEEENKIYFLTLFDNGNSKMSQANREKIDLKLGKEVLKYCDSNNLNVRFTNDYNRSHYEVISSILKQY